MAKKKIFSIDIDWDHEQVDAEFKRFEEDVRLAVSGIAVTLFKTILARSPQYSGSYVASWTMSVGSPVYANRRGWVPMLLTMPDDETGEDVAAPYSKGDRPAIDQAIAESFGFTYKFNLGDTVWIANGVMNEEGDHYGAEIEALKVNLRAVNRPGDALNRSINSMDYKYAEVSAYAVNKLKNQIL